MDLGLRPSALTAEAGRTWASGPQHLWPRQDGPGPQALSTYSRGRTDLGLRPSAPATSAALLFVVTTPFPNGQRPTGGFENCPQK